MTLYKIYKQSVVYPSIILLIIAVSYSIIASLINEKEIYENELPMVEIIVLHVAAALLYGLLICTAALTIFLNKSERISSNSTLSALSWFLLPGGFMCAVLGKAINEYITVNSSWEVMYAVIANLPFIVGLLIGFRKFKTSHRS